MTMTTGTTTPHPLNSKYEFLTISLLTKNPHVVLVSLDRPRKRNAINAKASVIKLLVVGRLFAVFVSCVHA